MSIVRVGTSAPYAAGWDHIFGGTKAKGRAKKASKKASPKAATKASKKAGKKAAKGKAGKKKPG